MKRATWPWIAVFVAAVAWRLGLFFAYRPAGVEPDGLGLAVLFSLPETLRAALPVWSESLLAKVAGYWPPGYPLANAAVGAIVGDALLAGRLVSALAAGGLAVVLGLLARDLTGQRSAGLFAGALAATTPLAVFWDTRVRPETLFWLFLAVALWQLIRYVREPRRSVCLTWAVAASGLAACVKYEAVVLLPALLVAGVALGRDRRRRPDWRIVPALIPWALALAWLATHQQDRAGDYANLVSTTIAWQFPLWFGGTLAALPYVITWPAFALALLGVASLWSDRATRPVACLLAYLVVGYAAAIAVGYNWIARYLLLLIPPLLVAAAAGWARLPHVAWLRWGVVALTVVANLFMAQQWIAAEQDRWRETIDIGRAVAAQVPAGATVWTDDPYLAPYWAGRDLRPLDDPAAVRPGDFFVLNDFYGALRRKALVDDTLDALGRIGPVTIISEYIHSFTPLAGDVIDPARLAQAADLRALGPDTFRDRATPITVMAVLGRMDENP